MPGLGTTFGRGGATTAQQDLEHADAILIMGSSMAENHPVGFRWVIKARERGATVIHVDPRFTRTSAMSDMWVPLRAGSDIVFLGALINHVLANNLEFRDYVVPYTNASTIISSDFEDTEELDGLFSGWHDADGSYSPRTWRYDGARQSDQDVGHEPEGGGHAKDRAGEASKIEEPHRDPALQHPRCVFQILKRHYARYTPAMVEDVCGVPSEAFLRVAEAFCRASGPDKTAAICYAVGWTQHSTGVQIIRTAAILQLLLGNIGRPGGGILALRGHASIQGSTDIPTLYDILPGYIPMPAFGPDTTTLGAYLEKHRSHGGWWANLDKFVVSLLKAWYGAAATSENDFGFGWLPRISGDHSHFGYWLDMADGDTPLEGLFVMGQNPAVGAPNARLERRAMTNLKWLVVRDMVETETASFWLDSPEVQRGELRTPEIGTEVFFFPAAGHAEKDGCFTNTQRLLQWHEKAVDPPGQARSEAWFMYHLGRRLKARAAKDCTPRNAGLNALTWDYPTRGPHDEPDSDAILREINGHDLTRGEILDGFRFLRDDGSTACGCWIYSGVYEDGRNRARERTATGVYGHGWGYAWPADRRILYNRASARPDGRPWSDRKKLIWWDEASGEWTGADNPDFTRDKRPDYLPAPGASGDAAIRGDAPFVMHPDGVGWIWVSSGLKDGPLPAHYEPLESPVRNSVYAQQTNPAADPMERPDNAYAHSPGDPRYPHVLTTYRLTEHHTAGGMTRTLSHLAELQPELFAEISPELGAQIGARNGQMIIVATPRGEIRARALVTPRIRPVTIHGRQLHQVGLPYHFGGRGLVTGDVVNDLIAISQEPNVRIMEAKALVCSVRVATAHVGTSHVAPRTSDVE
ncbi:MAG: molybdopterin-dependent oxidoreductase [Acidobacteria bacterium]|nr:molybdopterin-dependent oxidoreductase [Acidobacteriota bacterium]